jgi:hypothetical protein
VKTCPDCDEPLVEESSGGGSAGASSKDEEASVEDERSDADIEFVKILHTYNPGDIAMLKSVLEAAGITYYIQGENIVHIRPYADPAILLVDRRQEAEARELLKDMKIEFFTFTVDVSTDEENRE